MIYPICAPLAPHSVRAIVPTSALQFGRLAATSRHPPAAHRLLQHRTTVSSRKGLLKSLHQHSNYINISRHLFPKGLSYLTMAFLKYQHRPQPDSVDSAAPNIDPERLHLLKQRAGIDRIECYVCSIELILAEVVCCA